ncbi:MAG: DNA polymerase III subunit delta [Bacteroidetes bacterium]|nr:DNA polymerase III subunit delta [Bacteroidota bacterium]
MTFEQILADLKNKIFRPIYLLSGEEPFYIDEIADYIEKYTLTDDEKEFNQSVLYGKDIDINTIVNNAKRFPMMANYQVVIVKEAQEIDKIEGLNSYLENIQNSTILVLCYKYKKIDGRTSFKKNIEKKGVFFESKKLYENEISNWIINYLKKKEFQITPSACKLLADFLGTDLQKIVNEINKLIINVPQNTSITPEIIEDNIGISKDFNVFELQKALGNKEIVKANQIINYFAANPRENPLVKILPILYSFFVKILTYIELTDKSQKNAASVLGVNPFFVKDYDTASRKFTREQLHQIISLLRIYDVKSKGVDNASATDGELMKELVYKILH